MKLTLNHIALLTSSVKEAARHFSSYPVGPEELFPGEGTREIYVGDPEKERALLLLMEPTREGSYQNALQKRGPGLHHIAIDVPELKNFLSNLSGWFLLPRSIASIEKTKTAWLARPGFPALIELQERESMATRTSPFVQKLEIPGLEKFSRLLSPFALPELADSPDGEFWLQLPQGRKNISAVTGAEATISQPILETARLRLEPFAENDAADIFAYASNPRITEFLTWKPHASIEDSKTFLKWTRSSHSVKKGSIFFPFAIRLKETKKVIGSISFRQPDPWIGQLDYALGVDHWNKGYMTEATAELVRWALATLPEVERIQSFCLPENSASQRIMEKTGMTFEGIQKKGIKVKGKILDLAHYALVRKN